MTKIPTMLLGDRINALGSYCTTFLDFFFFNFTHYFVGDGTKIHCWEDLWFGNKSLSGKFPNIYSVVRIRNPIIASVLIPPPYLYLGTLINILKQ